VTLDGGIDGGLYVVHRREVSGANLLMGQVFRLQLDIGVHLNLGLYLHLPLVVAVVTIGTNHVQ
jgi:hypothetical protein